MKLSYSETGKNMFIYYKWEIHKNQEMPKLKNQYPNIIENPLYFNNQASDPDHDQIQIMPKLRHMKKQIYQKQTF